MTTRNRETAEKLLRDAGFHGLLVYQPQHLFVRNGRKLQVAEPGDPWRVTAHYADRFYQVTTDDPVAGARVLTRQANFPALHRLAEAVADLSIAVGRVRR